MDVKEILMISVQSMWLMLPLFISNPSAVFTGNKRPIDFGKSFSDGTRILGDGKSWGGLVGGTLIGMVAGLAMAFIIRRTDTGVYWQFGASEVEILKNVFIISFGALFGDSAASFVKRRLKFKRGEAVPGLDQYDMIAGVWLLLLIFSWGWFTDMFLSDGRWVGLIAVLILTPILHRVANIIGYKIGVKEVPW